MNSETVRVSKNYLVCENKEQLILIRRRKFSGCLIPFLITVATFVYALSGHIGALAFTLMFALISLITVLQVIVYKEYLIERVSQKLFRRTKFFGLVISEKAQQLDFSNLQLELIRGQKTRNHWMVQQTDSEPILLFKLDGDSKLKQVLPYLERWFDRPFRIPQIVSTLALLWKITFTAI